MIFKLIFKIQNMRQLLKRFQFISERNAMYNIICPFFIRFFLIFQKKFCWNVHQFEPVLRFGNRKIDGTKPDK